MSQRRFNVVIDHSRNEIFSDFAQATLNESYLLPGEASQDAFARVADAYGDDQAHAQRLYDYMSKLWFVPSSPILSNGGTNRGLPIACFLNEVGDDMHSIVDTWVENIWLAAKGGGIGTYWGNVRSIGEKIGRVGKTSGIVPFLKVQDSISLAIAQGSLRRGSAAVYLSVEHPEIEEFVDIRRFTGGDPNRKAQNLHNAVCISDAFMEAVEKGADWDLKSPHTGETVRTIKARDLWIRILTCRVEMGEPYILFTDTVNRMMPQHLRDHGLKVKMSNLCSEITLPTGRDHLGNWRTAVCCLSSVNLDKFDEWQDDPRFIEDLMRYLDNVLQGFIDTAPDELHRAKYAATRERSVGLGAMGFHSFLQKYDIPFESAMAKAWNKRIFTHLRTKADEASRKLADERGACPDAEHLLIKERFSHKLAIAPNATSSIICNNVSPGIEPLAANSFTQKTKAGNFNVRNRYLKTLLAKKGKDDAEIWSTISVNHGSVQHLDFLTQEEKNVFKTAFEIDQRWILEHATDRTPFICQAQSVNVFLPADVHKSTLHNLHFMAWKKGLKSVYYCRSKSIQRAEVVSFPTNLSKADAAQQKANKDVKFDEECLACQG